MARMTINGFSELYRDLSSLASSRIGEKMLKSGEPVLLDSVKKHAGRHRKSGDMAASVKSTGVKKGADGAQYLVVRPTGRDHNGVRNMEKAAYLEFGTAKQNATPVISPAVKEAEGRILSNMEKAFDETVRSVSV